ncbi:hypothetical protein VTL71DRAFT_11831 [Oculimacula yallundae]|uniref:Rad60/SUMO-like domain-containing protein n=1 Tax=Oculimacula yallundae TaxID=86028 RepID=A0ABR4CT07_9HELO
MDEDFGDLSAEEAPPPPPPPPKVKRSLFAKKITAKVPADSEPVDFYSRAKDTFPQRRAEEERRRLKKLEKLVRKRSSTSVEVKEGSPSGEKRRKVSEQREGYSSDENAGKQATRPDANRKDSAHSSHEKTGKRDSPNSLLARYTKDINARKSDSPKAKTAEKGYISLSDSEEDGASADEEEIARPPTKLPVRYPTRQQISLSDDEDDFTIAPRKVRPPPPVEDIAEKSDEEFPELVAAAKERARKLAEQKLAAAAAFSTQNHEDVDGDDVFSTGAAKNTEPVIDILVTSHIEGSKPLAVKRKLYAKLREVRWAWCDRQILDGQKLSQETKDSIFLTWKGNKLWDWSDCSGCVENYDDGKVHLEAWTQDVFEAWKKKGDVKSRGSEHSEEDEIVKEAPVPRTKLFMKSRQFPDYKLIVKPSTTIQKMIDAFRSSNDVPDNQGITLHFDGDKLDPDDKIEDTELGDLDSVEVHIQ